MTRKRLTRRDFMKDSAVVAAGAAVVAGAAQAGAAKADEDVKKTRSYNPEMEYRRLGKTGLWVSAVSLGGHWKRIDKVLDVPGRVNGWAPPKSSPVADAFHKNRYETLTRCIERGINLVDACSGPEIMAYAHALRGRREKMFLCFSWYEKEPRFPGWRTKAKLLQGLDEGLRDAKLEYADLWRISAHIRGSQHTTAEEEAIAEALAEARKAGKVRFTGISSHDRPWLRKMIETYPDAIQAVLTPYTANSKELPEDSLFDAVRKHDVGVLGIKPFASNSLFKGDGSPESPHAAEDDRRARLALRYILCNPAITAPIPGLISNHQVENAVAAVKERRTLDSRETAELEAASRQMWANLPQGYQWLKEWEYV